MNESSNEESSIIDGAKMFCKIYYVCPHSVIE